MNSKVIFWATLLVATLFSIFTSKSTWEVSTFVIAGMLVTLTYDYLWGRIGKRIEKRVK